MSLSIVEIPVEKISDGGYNPRRIDDAGLARLRKSLETFGLVEPLVVNDRRAARWKGDRSMVCVSGHQRLRLLKEMGRSTAPCVVVALPKSQEQALNLRLNRHEGAWDEKQLVLVLRTTDMELSGFSLDETTALFDREAEESLLRTAGAVDDDDTPEPPSGEIEIVSRPGKIYRLGPHRLACGDSTEIETYEHLLDGKPVQMIFTDPPYNVNYNPRKTMRAVAGKKVKRDLGGIMTDGLSGADFGNFLTKMASCCRHVLAPGGVGYFCMGHNEYHHLVNALEAEGWKHSALIIWVKQSGTMTFGDYSPATEMVAEACRPGKKIRRVRILHGGGALAYAWPKGDAHRFYGEQGQTNVWWLVDREDTSKYQHPTQKPVALPLRAILNNTRAGDTVLDCFGGSGSTLIAAEKAGRVARLVELDPKWCDVIRRRWKRFTTGEDDGWDKEDE